MEQTDDDDPGFKWKNGTYWELVLSGKNNNKNDLEIGIWEFIRQ